MRRILVLLLVLEFLLIAGCIQSGTQPQPADKIKEAEPWIRDSLAVKQFLKKEPSAELEIRLVSGTDFSSEEKKLFLGECNKKWREDANYFVVKSRTGEQTFWAWLLPDKKTDCFAWKGISAEENAVAQTTLTISDATVSNATTDTATIKWKTNLPSMATIHYGQDISLKETVSETSSSKNHSIVLTDLVQGTTYFFKIEASTKDQNAIAPQIRFKTLGLPPAEVLFEITDINVLEIQPDFVKIHWKTTLPATSVVRYGTTARVLDSNYSETKPISDHFAVLEGLRPFQGYVFKIITSYPDGRTAESLVHQFITLTRIDLFVDSKKLIGLYPIKKNSVSTLTQLNFGFEVANVPLDKAIKVHFELFENGKTSFCTADLDVGPAPIGSNSASYTFGADSDCFNKPLSGAYDYRFVVQLDSSNVIKETNEKNNSAESTISVR